VRRVLTQTPGGGLTRSPGHPCATG